MFDSHLPEFRTFLLERYGWVFEDDRITTPARGVRPLLKERFRLEARIVLDLFPATPLSLLTLLKIMRSAINNCWRLSMSCLALTLA